ncbi:poly-gamma-glutamate synthase PgsB [Micromonospora sp. M12]
MVYLYTVYSLCCLALLVAGVIEQRNHNRNLNTIPHRVLVNGIRGKSSITRLCAGALRGGGKVVVAKTTGTAARFIFPDASEEPVHRKFGIANVVEQIGIVRRAAVYHPDALVIECMAVMPALQEINQSKLIRSTIGVLCNVREDHLAEMGPTLDDVARSLSRSMPEDGICITAEKDRLAILQQEAAKRNCQLIAVDPESVTDREMAGFGWITFKENVAIALAVAEQLGVDRHSALTGMWSAPPDRECCRWPESSTAAKGPIRQHLRRQRPESTYMNIEQLEKQQLISQPLTMVINCRPDRMERNGQMGTLAGRVQPQKVVLIGEMTRSARVNVPEELQSRVVDLGAAPPERLVSEVMAVTAEDASIVAVGNIHGQGEVLLHELAALPSWEPQDRTRAESMLRPPTARTFEVDGKTVFLGRTHR